MLNEHEQIEAPEAEEREHNQGPVVALLLSLALHALLLAGIQLKPESDASVFEIEMLPSPVTRKQIVSPSQSPELKPPKDTNRTSERDSNVEKESIRRAAEPKPQSLDNSQNNDKPRPPQNPEKEDVVETKNPTKNKVKTEAKSKIPAVKEPSSKTKKENSSKTAKLRLPADRLPGSIPIETKTEKFKGEEKDPAQSRLDALLSSSSNPASNSNKSDRERERLLREYRPFGSQGIGSIFNRRSGSADYLPNVTDGDLTLLNAKADRHAVFVRRVALQVFGALRRESWAELSYQSIRRLKDYTTIRAVMSPEGRLLEVIYESGSGVGEFDNLVKKAAKIGAWDKNPPASARHADGNIHFIFKARSWSRPMGEARREQRWLLLSTGLL
jgi:outer membrane biosynthesis protein TonB